MKKYITIGVLFILVLMAASNPTKSEYVDWAREQVREQSSSSLFQFGVDLIGGQVIEYGTTSSNYLFFSVYTTTLFDREVTTVGVFRNFIPISSKELGE